MRSRNLLQLCPRKRPPIKSPASFPILNWVTSGPSILSSQRLSFSDTNKQQHFNPKSSKRHTTLPLNTYLGQIPGPPSDTIVVWVSKVNGSLIGTPSRVRDTHLVQDGWRIVNRGYSHFFPHSFRSSYDCSYSK